MPKEITHWFVAEQTAIGLRGTRFGDAAMLCPNALKMGAVFPDMPYYVTGASRQARVALNVAREYHGAHGADTYRLLRTLLSGLGGHEDPAHKAFLVGVVSHLQADMVFHPLVFFLTGNSYDPDPSRRSRAIRDHRRFEGMLDVHVCEAVRMDPRAFQARTICNKLESPDLLYWAKQVPGHPDLHPLLQSGIKKFVAAQRWFSHPLAVHLASTLDPFLPETWRELTALLYLPIPEQCKARLFEKLDYRNPVSGEPGSATVGDLLDKAVDRGVVLCNRLEEVLDGGDPGGFTEPGPSLNFGLVGSDVSMARYFALPSFFEGCEAKKR